MLADDEAWLSWQWPIMACRRAVNNDNYVNNCIFLEIYLKIPADCRSFYDGVPALGGIMRPGVQVRLVAFTLLAAALKELLPNNSLMHLGLLSVCYLGLFIVVCRLAGMNQEMIRSEMNQLRSMLSGK